MWRHLPKNFLYAAFVIIPFGLIFFNSQGLHRIKMVFMSAGTASVAAVTAPVDELRRLFSYRAAWRELRQLRRESDSLKARIVAQEEAVGRGKRYARLLGLRDTLASSTVAVTVIARDPANWNSSLLVGKGKDDGIRPGMAVVNASGVVGRVAEVASDVAKVILVNDPGFSVAVVDQRSRESGLLSGSLSGMCRLDYLSDTADIRPGDEVVTSSLSDVFPGGLRVGTVETVVPGKTGTPPRAFVRPVVETGRIEEVLVIR